MPIRPEMKPLYPPPKEWKALRQRILARAKDACECRGECGVPHAARKGPLDDTCAVPNGATVTRQRMYGSETWEHHTGCSLCLGGDPECKAVRVVLTIAHLDHNPTNNSDENLRALCQRCHLRYDRHEHLKNGHATRRKNRAIGWIPGVKQ